MSTSEGKKFNKKMFGIDILIRIIIFAIAYVLIFVICPMIHGTITLECVVIVIIIVVLITDLIPGTGKGGW
ncbi:MAG: hypothetical protein AM326_09675 [Candidatus Thorarchaeota archaeon SMTZ-45]|nr:MAG: hypothetical protein AM325_14050 [Candidatus Thorarchaeota archaeon SMTZ1-45]KXH74649.1 MAG: hypothetical protein AM326_09675 [Candidatus Thorarchaeota archaeon SMTZ-45]